MSHAYYSNENNNWNKVLWYQTFVLRFRQREHTLVERLERGIVGGQRA